MQGTCQVNEISIPQMLLGWVLVVGGGTVVERAPPATLQPWSSSHVPPLTGTLENPSPVTFSLPGSARIARPLRLLELVTGERFYVEWLYADRHAVEVRWRGHRVRLRWERVARLSTLPGVVDLLDESFESQGCEVAPLAHSGCKVWQNSPSLPGWSWKPPEPIREGQLQWCQRRGSPDSAGIHVRLNFACGQPPAVLDVRTDSAGKLTALPPPGWTIDFRQPLVLSDNWEPLSVDWDEEQWRVLWRDVVLATGRKPAQAWCDVTWETTGHPATIWIDDLRVSARQAVVPLMVEHNDVVILQTGDGIYGRVRALDANGLEVQGNRSRVHIPWPEWQAVQLSQTRPDVSPSQFVHGTWHLVETRPPLWPRGLPAESWLAACEPLVAQQVTVWNHPWLGRLHVPETAIERKKPLHGGSFSWLLGGLVHLGDEVRPTFACPEPQGTAVGGEFELRAQPHRDCSISLEVVELEPAGDQTPPTEPWLTRLRSGALRTELYVNGRLVGDWNRLLAWRPSQLQRERLRMSVPANWLQPGRNTWEIRQQPWAPGDPRYDDCEIGRVLLEIAP